MKKFDRLKTIQLIIFALLAGVCVYLVFTNSDLYHAISNNPDTRLICGLLWAILGLSFIFIFIDFVLISSYKKDYHELDYAVHSDSVAGIANRNSCDQIIEKYQDKLVPDGIGCVMFDLTNIKQINEAYGYAQGNILIRDFANILKRVSVALCFVGRNGGNKFLAIFEDSTQEDIDLFLSRIQQKVHTYNVQNPSKPIEYQYGVAFEEGPEVRTITDMVSLSNRRIYEDTEA